MTHPLSVATLFPAFAKGWIVIDARDEPRLANAIGSKIYQTARGAQARLQLVRRCRSDSEYLHAIPVDGPNGVFALDFVFGDAVVIDTHGSIRMRGGSR